MATLTEINDIYAAIQFRPPPPTDPVVVNSYLPLTVDQVINSIEAEAYTQNVVNPVIREFQAAFGRVPDQAGQAYWVQQFGLGNVSLSDISLVFASSTEFFDLYGVGPTAPANVALIDALYTNVLQRTADSAGETFWLNSGLNASQLLEAFAQSGEFITNTNPHIVAFQNLEAAGTPPTTGSLFDVNDTGFDLTIFADTPPAFATDVPGAIFDAAPGANVLGPSNTLNAGDNLQDAALDGTLNYHAVASLTGNPALATGVTMFGIENATILNSNIFGVAGFSGNITGLHNVSLEAGSTGGVLVGLPGAALVSALETVSVNASEDFTAWIASTALDGAADVLQLNLSNVSDSFDPTSFIGINVNTGTNAYEAINISSGGPLANEIVLDSFNFAGGAATTTALITVDGAQDLSIFGSVLNVATLDTFDGSAATGNLSVNFFLDGVDDGVTATGGSGDDVFTFFTDASSPTIFGVDDVVDGGAGDNRLRLQADEGVLLAAGVGANIVNIQTIEHFDVVLGGPLGYGTTGDISVDWSESGSATTLDLAANYHYAGGPANNVTVTNLTNADTVLFSGDDVADLTLTHVSAVGSLNLTLAMNDTVVDSGFAPPPVVQDIGALVVDNGLLVNLTSTGARADLNAIYSANLLDANVSIDGDTDLSIGSVDAYNFEDGTVDASAFTADLELFLGFNSQTAIGGLGDDHIIVETPSDFFGFFIQADVIDLSVGGADTVTFEEETWFANGSLPPSAADYHHVSGFSAADDLIELNATNIPMFNTDVGNPVLAGQDVRIVDYPNGTVVDYNQGGALTNFNLIRFDVGVPAPGVNSADDVFELAMGPAGQIEVNTAGQEFLMAFYDTTSSQMVLITAESFFDVGDGINVIDQTSDVDVIATVGMSFADFQAFDGSNLAFV